MLTIIDDDEDHDLGANPPVVLSAVPITRSHKPPRDGWQPPRPWITNRWGRPVADRGNQRHELSRTAAPWVAGELCSGSEARTTTPLGTMRNARSQVELGMWRGRAWRRRAGQAFKLSGPDVADGTTA